MASEVSVFYFFFSHPLLSPSISLQPPPPSAPHLPPPHPFPCLYKGSGNHGLGRVSGKGTSEQLQQPEVCHHERPYFSGRRQRRRRQRRRCCHQRYRQVRNNADGQQDVDSDGSGGHDEDD